MANGVTVDDASFQQTWKEYLRLNKRAIPELANKLGYEVSKLCVAKTASVPRDQIRASLQQPSRVSPTMTVGQVIANKMSIAKGEGGLKGAALASAGKKLEAFRARTGNFARSGFIPGVRAFSQIVKDKSPRSVNGVKTYGSAKGGADVANSFEAWQAKASVWNSVLGGVKKWFGAPARSIAKLQAIIIKGVQAALNTKEADMKVYIERKHNQILRKVSKA